MAEYNESQINSNETERISAEQERINNEAKRQTKETEREARETTRQSNESTRISKEAERLAEEINRQEAEASRVTAEQGRVEAENIREEFYEGFNDRLNEVDSQLAQNEKKEFVSIMDYGAIGDKINDDTQAIINALSKGRYVTAKGEKHYIITDLIEIPEHTTLDFNNAYVTFMGSDACFKLKKSSSIKNVRVNIPSGILLTKSVVYIDGNDVFHVGWSHTPTIENITIEQQGADGDISYRNNIGIWLDARQKQANTSCCISGVVVNNVKGVLLKHIIYSCASDEIGNNLSVYITSNTFRDIKGYNCFCFIKDEVLPNSVNADVSANVYDNLHFQPADGKETHYIDLNGAGNSILNPLFWDNTRPSNISDQIIIKGKYNYISGSMIPPHNSGYVTMPEKYNFFQGHTYGTPTQYFGGKYITDKTYQKSWKNKLLPVSTYIYDRGQTNVTSGVISNSSDTTAVEMPLTFGDLGVGYTKITIESIGTCKSTTQARRFYASFGSSKYFCGGSSEEVFASTYKCKVEFIIRKYEENYLDVIVYNSYTFGNKETTNKIANTTLYDLTDSSPLDMKLLMASTTEGDMTQLYYDIKISFHE